MTKYVYVWDAQNHWSDKKVATEDYKPQANETFDPVPEGANMPITRVANGWREATAEEHEAYVKAENAKHPDHQQQGPSKQDQALNALGLQIAEMQKTQATTAQAVNALGLKLAAQANTTATK